MSEDPDKIKITLEDLEGVSPPPPTSQDWGHVDTSTGGGQAPPPGKPPATGSSGGFFRKSWFYLSIAGLLGAFLAWGVTEPTYEEGAMHSHSETEAGSAGTGGVLDEFSRRLAREEAKTGEITVSLMWNDYNDLDLGIHDPSGELVYFKNKQGRHGELDVDMNVENYDSREPVENIYYQNPPEGEYTILVQHYSNHNQNPRVMPFTVRLRVGDETTDFDSSVVEEEVKELHVFNYVKPVVEPPEEITPGFGNWAMVPMVLMLACVGFGVAESASEGSARKALLRGSLALVLGAALGFAAFKLSNFCFAKGAAFFDLTENTAPRWLLRGGCWVFMGAACGITYGICGQSGRKCLYGVIGGGLGALLGGTLFDPVSIAIGGGETSRLAGLGLLGASTGLAIGLVESALKERWLLVTAGPLAGKQFILYREVTRLGTAHDCEIFLAKDPDILPLHAQIHTSGEAQILCHAQVRVNDNPAPARCRIHDGDRISIGIFEFSFREKKLQTRA